MHDDATDVVARTPHAVETSGHMWWNATGGGTRRIVVGTLLCSQEAVEMFPGLAGDHPATTHVVEGGVLSQETTCSGIYPHVAELDELASSHRIGQ